ncbi:DUF3310 domain-containing protein [Macrococcoides caseolyticum]|uniref:DUF3310 domain-containing protein n=1 Tax=Macrococcoides caseolyticum TaxID=69966 RepID=A0A855GSA7_9STAP|nr:DUF3310 domain-containing protein [Macrococcus caseolyticus]PKE27136.1 hypothetical protein CW686_01440 [Macrococcus caseolyticus]PKE59641.1 hypothetical protein CW673_01500 [Macrococcus caseolyticus]PKE71126.1 hypothetical protein CW662_01105 [Macrococcus caseolyticus]
MAKTLKGLVIKEVDQIIHETKTLKEAATKIGVAYQTLLQFRSENMKEFKKLKAEREQGLIVDEVPVVKTKPVEKNKGASTIPVNDVVDKVEHQKIVDDLQVNLALVTDDRDKHKEEVTKLNVERKDFMNRIKELEATITKKDEELQLKDLNIKAKERDIKSLKHSYDRLDKKSADALKMNDRFLTSKYEKELNQHKRTIEVSAEANKNLKESLQRANQVIKEYQDKETELVTSYEQQLEDKQNTIQKLETDFETLEKSYEALMSKNDNVSNAKWEKGPRLTLNIDRNKLIQSQLLSEIENKELAIKNINPPSHYAPNGLGTDVIGFLESQFSYEAYKGFMIGNIIKYATRTGRKDEEINELKKIVDYADRIISFLERDNKVADAR